MFRLLILFLFLSLSVQAQSPYRSDPGRDMAIIGTSLSLDGLAAYIHAKNAILHPEDLEYLDPNDVWKFDRWVTRQYSTSAKKGSDLALYGSFALPLIFLMDNTTRNDFGKIGLISLEALLINHSLTNITKTTVKRPRPYLYNTEVRPILHLEKTDQYSFFSGHTSTTAALAFLSAQLHSDYYPDSKAQPIIWGLAAAIPAYTGIQRMRAGKHFLSDVLLGYVVGAGIGILLPRLHQL